MPDITNSLSSPSWWFSTIIVALLINLLSSYAKPFIDGWFSRVSLSWRARSETRKTRIAQEVIQHSLNPHLLRDSSERESRLRQQAVYVLLLALFLLFFPQLIAIEPSSIENKSLSSAIALAFLLLKLFGFILTMASLTFSNAADERETVVRLANAQLQAKYAQEHKSPS